MKAVMYGAGNIGRGFIGALLSQIGYEVVFIDVNDELVNCLNEQKRYPQEIIGEEEHTVWVENVSAIHGTHIDDICEELTITDIMAISVGVNVLPHILPVIAQGLEKRWTQDRTRKLDILICENLMHADILLKEGLKKELSEPYKTMLDTHLGLVETAIGKMVPLMRRDQQLANPLRICVEAYPYLPFDKDACKTILPHSPFLIPYSPFAYYIERKLFIHNMAHMAIACYGKLLGYTYIEEAIKDSNIRLLVEHAMLESCLYLHKQYQIPMESLLAHVDDLLWRFQNPKLKDTLSRVARDPIRKLQPEDRMIGAIRSCEKMGLNTIYLCAATAIVLREADSQQPDKLMEDVCLISKKEAVGRRILYFLQDSSLSCEPLKLLETTQQLSAKQRNTVIS